MCLCDQPWEVQGNQQLTWDNGRSVQMWSVLGSQLQPCSSSYTWKIHKDELVAVLPFWDSVWSNSVRSSSLWHWKWHYFHLGWGEAMAPKLHWHFPIPKIRWFLLFKSQFTGQHSTAMLQVHEEVRHGCVFLCSINKHWTALNYTFPHTVSNTVKKLCCWPTQHIKVKVSLP